MRIYVSESLQQGRRCSHQNLDRRREFDQIDGKADGILHDIDKLAEGLLIIKKAALSMDSQDLTLGAS